MANVNLESLFNSDDEAMYGRTVYNYSNSYSIHPFNTNKNHYIPSDEQEVKGYNCTLGRVMRLVLYGNPELIDKPNVTYGIEV